MEVTNNSKYTSYLDIANKIARTFPSKSAITNPLDIASWCAECEIDFIGDIETYKEYVDVPLKVVQRKALLPCTLFKLYDIYRRPECEDIDIERIIPEGNDGTHLMFAQGEQFYKNVNGEDIVFIKYAGMAIDEHTGFPLIKKGHEYACERFCIKHMFEEDFLLGKINIAMWQDICLQLDNALLTAKQNFRHKTNNDMLLANKIRYNMIQQPSYIPIYKV